MKTGGTEKKLTSNGSFVMGKALCISTALHFVAALMITVKAVPVPATPDFVDLSMVTLEDVWSDPAVDPDPKPAVKAISYVEIARMTAAPRLLLHHHKYQWEDDIDPLIMAAGEINKYDFMKEQSDYAFVFDNIESRFSGAGGSDTLFDSTSLVNMTHRSDPGIRISGRLLERTLLNPAELDSLLEKISASLMRPMRMRIGIDSEGNVRHVLPEGRYYDAVSLSEATKLALSMRFRSDQADTGTLWGNIEITPVRRERLTPAENPDTGTERSL